MSKKNKKLDLFNSNSSDSIFKNNKNISLKKKTPNLFGTPLKSSDWIKSFKKSNKKNHTQEKNISKKSKKSKLIRVQEKDLLNKGKGETDYLIPQEKRVKIISIYESDPPQFDVEIIPFKSKVTLKPEKILEGEDPLHMNGQIIDKEDINKYNFDYCGLKNRKDVNDPYFKPFFLTEQQESYDIIQNNPGIPDTEPILKDDPGFYYKIDKYLSGNGGDCDYNVPDRRKINFHTCNMTKQGGIKLYRYQKLVTEYISPETPYRGLLVYQGLGSGKTILSISVLSNFIKREPDRTIIVVTPPGLRQNFEMELNKFSPFELFGQEIGKEVEEEIMKKIKNGNNDKIEQERKKIFRKYWEKRIAIYSYEELANRLQRRRVSGKLENNSTLWKENILDKCLEKGISNITGEDNRKVGVCRGTTLSKDSKKVCPTLPEKLCDAKDKKFLDTDEFPSLENTLIIIDEAHKLINPNKDDSIYAPIILRAIRRANDIRVLLLTATPIDKKPFELGILLNLLKNKNSQTRFPEVIDENGILNLEETEKKFNETFTKLENGVIVPANKNMFLNNCKGLVSYYNTELDLTKFAKRLYEPDQNALMSDEILKRWRKERNKEIKLLENKKLPLSCYNTDICDKNRKLSDFDASRITEIRKNTKDLDKHSTKIALALKNINDNYSLGKQFVYSYWDNEGVMALSEALKLNGWYQYDADNLVNEYIENCGTKRDRSIIREKGWEPKLKKKIPERKSFITMGKLTNEKWREAVVKAIFNRKENYLGKEINLLIVNRKYSEGISLKNMRVCHILEPPVSESLKEQIVGRCIRDCSHTDLPFKDWNVKIYNYYSTISKEEEGIFKRKEIKTQEGVLEDKIKEMIKEQKIKDLYEGPLRTPEGTLLNEDKVRECLNKYDKCLDNIKDLKDTNKEEYEKRHNKCLRKKNECITNSKIRNGQSPGGIEMEDVKNVNKYDYINNWFLKKEGLINEKYSEDKETFKIRDEIEQGIANLEKMTDKMEVLVDDIPKTITPLNVNQSIINKKKIREDIIKIVEGELPFNKKIDNLTEILTNLSVLPDKEKESMQKEIKHYIENFKRKMLDNMLQEKLSKKELEEAIKKSKEYDLKKGDFCIYTPNKKRVEILEVKPGFPYYYLVQFTDGSERYTTIERLEKNIHLYGGNLSSDNVSSITDPNKMNKSQLREKLIELGVDKKEAYSYNKTNSVKKLKELLKITCSKRNPPPPCQDGYYPKITNKGEECCFKEKKNTKKKKSGDNFKSKKKVNNDYSGICNIKDTVNPEGSCNNIDFCQWNQTENKCIEVGTDKSLSITASKNSRQSSDFLKMLKESAIDCVVFKNANEKDLKCYRPELPKGYLKKEEMKKDKINKNISQEFAKFQDYQELDCSQLQKKECIKERKCYYKDPNVFAGAVGIDTGCKKLPIDNINCHILNHSKDECNKMSHLCEWKGISDFDLPLLIPRDNCEFIYNKNMRNAKNAIMLGFKEEGNNNYSGNSEKVYTLENKTEEVLENRINNYLDKLGNNIPYQDIDKILTNLTHIFYEYSIIRNRLSLVTDRIEEYKQNNLEIWDVNLNNKFFNLLNTTKLKPPPNIKIIMGSDILCEGCPVINLKKLSSIDRIQYALKLNNKKNDYYIRTDEELYKQHQWSIPIKELLQNGYYEQKIIVTGLEISVTFETQGNNLSKIYVEYKNK